MIYYLVLLATGVLIDYKDLKQSNKKSDVIFYIISIIVCIIMGMLYFSNINEPKVAEFFVRLFRLGGI